MADDRSLTNPTADVPDAGTAPPEASNEELSALAGGGMDSSASPLSGGDYSESAAQGNPEFFQPNNTPQQPSNLRPWARILMGAMQGMAGADGKSFAGGVSGGIRSYQAYQQLQVENNQRQEQLAMAQQRTMDAHQVAQSNLATAHLEQQNLVRAYNLAPKSTQDIIDQASMSAGEKAKELPGTKIIGSYGTYAEAQTQATAEMKANTMNPLNTMIFHNAQGGFDVMSVANPEKLNDKPVDVTIGYDFKSKQPITKTYAAGTISFAQQMSMETNAVSKAADANNGLEEFRQKQQIEQGKEIAVLKAKQQMDSNPVYAVNAQGDTVLTTKAAATQSGMSAIRGVKQTDIRADQHDIKVLSDIQTKSNNVAAASGAMDAKSWSDAIDVAKYLSDHKGTTLDNISNEKVLKNASPQAQRYLIAINSLRESSMGLQKVLTGSARSNESQIKALQQTLPGFEPNSDIVKQKLQAFDQNLGLLSHGLPKNTGVELQGFEGQDGKPHPGLLQKYSH